MKIAFIGQKGMPATSGGVEKHVEELSARLAGLGHAVFVYNRPSYADANLKTHKGVKLISLSSIPTKRFDAISHTFYSIFHASKCDYDLVHFHSIGPSSLIWLFKLLNPNTPVVATFHSRDYFHKKWGSEAKLFLKLGERILCHLADEIIAVSKGIKAYAEEKYKRPANYLPNGTNSPVYRKPDKIKFWGLEKGNYILAVGRLIPHKGFHYLIEAYNQLKTDKKLVIVGDGFFTDVYAQKLEKLSLANKNIILTGKQFGDTLEEIYSNAYVFVQPSEYEGLSMVLIEAMAYGLPVLISDIKDNTDVTGDAAYKFKNKSSKDLCLKLKEILSAGLETKTMGEKAQQIAAKDFMWDNIVDSTEKIYFKAKAEKKQKKSTYAMKLANRIIHSMF